MWLMDSISVVVTELPDNLAYPFVIVLGECIAYDGLEPARMLCQRLSILTSDLHLIFVLVWTFGRLGRRHATTARGSQERCSHVAAI